MSSAKEIIPSAEFRETLKKISGSSANRCYQCATCSSVCQLAPEDAPFPRRQMLMAQWGLADRIASDPAVWLCHQCNDCTLRCPRDAKPGDVMQAVRSLAVQNLATPRFMGKLVGNAGTTWPLLLGIPFAIWVVALYLVNGLTIPAETPLAYHNFVPHWLIYIINIPTTALVALAVLASAVRFWNLMGTNAERSGSFVSSLIAVLTDIATHERFGKCEFGGSRRWGHFLFMWGFVGAAIATGLVVLGMYLPGFDLELPIELSHPFKLIGNAAAVLLVVGGVMLLLNRMEEDERAGATTAYDAFFLTVVLLVVITGVLTEAGRILFDPQMACWIYIVHLSAVLCLFYTFPYSKFAHMVYRTLAMVHERMAVKK